MAYICTSEAAVLGAIDYKMAFAKTYESEEARMNAYSECHTRSAQRLLKALLANGGMSLTLHVSACYCQGSTNCLRVSHEGIFIKLGQHMASM